MIVAKWQCLGANAFHLYCLTHSFARSCCLTLPTAGGILHYAVLNNIDLYGTPGAAASKALWQGYNSTLAQLLDTMFAAGGVWNNHYRNLEVFNTTHMVFVSATAGKVC